MKKAPLLMGLVVSCVILTLICLTGRKNIYLESEDDILTRPYFSRIFEGMNRGYYPWDIFDEVKRNEAVSSYEEKLSFEDSLRNNQSIVAENSDLGDLVRADLFEYNDEGIVTDFVLKVDNSDSKDDYDTVKNAGLLGDVIEARHVKAETDDDYSPRYEPMRETTYEEYKANISADVYGEDGENFAKGYDNFVTVDESYFDDALFLGDSRTVGLNYYTDISEHADFLCETSLSIWKMLKSNYGGKGTVDSYLKKKRYGKIYIMVGVNELGTGTTEKFLKEYTEVVDHIADLQPEAIIYIQAIMNVDKYRSDSDKVFNNANILARNHALATLADNDKIFYLDINEVLCDDNGYLKEELRGDHLHLKASSNEVWKSYLMSHAVVCDE